jgi:hypothetical protein
VVWYKSFLYQAGSWRTARRVVAKVEFHFGKWFPGTGFIVTNLETDSRAVVRFYNKRGNGGAVECTEKTGLDFPGWATTAPCGAKKAPRGGDALLGSERW